MDLLKNAKEKTRRRTEGKSLPLLSGQQHHITAATPGATATIELTTLWASQRYVVGPWAPTKRRTLHEQRKPHPCGTARSIRERLEPAQMELLLRPRRPTCGLTRLCHLHWLQSSLLLPRAASDDGPESLKRRRTASRLLCADARRILNRLVGMGVGTAYGRRLQRQFSIWHSCRAWPQRVASARVGGSLERAISASSS